MTQSCQAGHQLLQGISCCKGALLVELVSTARYMLRCTAFPLPSLAYSIKDSLHWLHDCQHDDYRAH